VQLQESMLAKLDSALTSAVGRLCLRKCNPISSGVLTLPDVLLLYSVMLQGAATVAGATAAVAAQVVSAVVSSTQDALTSRAESSVRAA
jgi:hypothetical protein